MVASAINVLKSKRCRPCHAFGTFGRPTRAVRPLAASAPLASLRALEGHAGSSASSPRSVSSFGHNCCPSFQRPRRLAAPERRNSSCWGFLLCQELQSQSSRLRARQGTEGRASTSCFAARAGEVRLLACSATQRTMRRQVGRVPFGARPNPSIERTRPGKPVLASHVKR